MNTSKSTGTNKDDWQRLGDDLRRKIDEAARRPSFVIYCVTVILWVGGMGFWIPVGRFVLGTRTAQSASEIAAALATFFLAVTASAMGDVVLADDEEEEGDTRTTHKRAHENLLARCR